MKKVLIFGKFDIVHPGHIYFITQAKQFGQITAVLESDKMIKELKNYQPFNSEKIRSKNLKQFGVNVYLRNGEDAKTIIEKLKPDVLCFGHDQEFLRQMFSGLTNFAIKNIEPFGRGLFKSSRLVAVLEDEQAGLYLVDKAKGEHSFRLVAVFRKMFNLKKVGFSGTLDPLASGLMIVAVSKATRMLDWFHYLPKIYVADILFGQSSDTYDLAGQISIDKNAKSFSQKDLEIALRNFLGKQKQTAPAYSAKKIRGQKLHELARAGQLVDLPKADIEIYSLKIKSFHYPNLKLEVSCSAGTYIRSLANDLGKQPKTSALLADLRRISIGDFNIKDALTLAEINNDKLSQARILPQAIIASLNQWFFRSPL